MTIYYKAIRPDGFDFHTQTVDYGKAAKSRSKKLKHPAGREAAVNASAYLSVATVPTDCTGMKWPARLLEVEAVGPAWEPHVDLPNKRAVLEMKIIRELPAWQVFGAEGERIVKLIERFDARTPAETEALRNEYNMTSTAFWNAENAVVSGGRARRAGLGAARGALGVRLIGGGGGGEGATFGAALALLCRPHVPELFTQAEYDALSRPWRMAIGEIHPDDKAVK